MALLISVVVMFQAENGEL